MLASCRISSTSRGGEVRGVAKGPEGAQLVLLETDPWNFAPLSLLRSVPELRVGALTLLERAAGLGVECGAPIVVLTRRYLRDLLGERLGEGFAADADSIETERVLILDPTYLVDGALRDLLRRLDSPGRALVSDGRLVAALVRRVALLDALSDPGSDSGFTAKDLLRSLSDELEEKFDVGGLLRIGSVWDLIPVTEMLLPSELDRLVDGRILGDVDEQVRVLGDRSRIHIGRGSVLEPFVTLDLRRGPIFIGESVRVMSHTRIEGPCFVGDGTVVFPGSNVASSYIGPVCRVGGEVESSVVLGYSNKRHYGYLGHSYVGEWVNLGAGTTVSNLKNTYGTVRVRLGGASVDTGRIFLGPVIGDHVKSAIGTLVFSGKSVGSFSHIYGFVTSDVPPFAVSAKPLVGELFELELESALETARRMMSRRGLSPSQAYERAVRAAFELTAEERRSHGVRRERFRIP